MRAKAVVPSTLVLLCLAPSAFAQEGFAHDRFEPSERGSDWFSLDSLDLRGTARPAIGIVGDYSYRSLVLYNRDDNVNESVVRNDLVLHAGASFVFLDRFRVAADLPFQLYEFGHTGTSLADGKIYSATPHDQALGDLRLSGDIRVLGEYGDPFTAAIGAQVSLPTGDQASYMSDGAVRVQPRVSVAGDIGPVAYAARAGFQYRGSGVAFDGSPIGNELTFGGSVGLRAFDKALLIGPEVYGSTVVSDGAAFETKSTPVEGLFGPHLFLANGLRFGAGVGAGFTRGLGAPVSRAVFNVEWALPYERHEDRDGDGVEDAKDACPETAGVASADPAMNGCPPPPAPPADRDADGIPDSSDACPDAAGSRSDDPAKNGCPADSDADGIADSKDACPNVAGGPSDDPKKNGCPADRDSDGIADAKDACPDEAGVVSSNPKFNGCPDDIDHDGVKNDVDACPNEAGAADPDPSKNGCPKAFVQNGQIRITDQVKFKTNSAELVAGKDSDDVLEAVLKVLQTHAEITKVSVEGYTDNTGSPAHNKALSAQRAQAVVSWLVKHGIEKGRLSSSGFGQDKPIADNSSAEGRAANRRVEFHIDR